MIWKEREFADDDDRQNLGRPGGDWQGMRPSFDNPFTWALTIARIGGISVRVHLLFLMFIVIMLMRSVVPPASGQPATLNDVALMSLAMTALFIIVLAHEFGHCLACRWAGGQANEILMWPLGGLAFCRPGHHWAAHLITAIGGPLVNVVFCAVSGLMLGILTRKWWGTAFPNPLDVFQGLGDPEVRRSWAHIALYQFNAMSMIILLFNLLPIFPLDGGRIVQAALWPKMGYSRSMTVAVRTGFIGAIVLGIFGAVTSRWEVVGIALFGGITCYITKKQLQWTDSVMAHESDEYALSLHSGRDDESPLSPRVTRSVRQAERKALREQEEAKEVDRILQKIADSGLSSLNKAERSLLQRATERKRHGP